MKKAALKKPRATAKDFPDLPKDKVLQLIRVCNQVVDILWPLEPPARMRALKEAYEKSLMEDLLKALDHLFNEDSDGLLSGSHPIVCDDWLSPDGKSMGPRFDESIVRCKHCAEKMLAAKKAYRALKEVRKGEKA